MEPTKENGHAPDKKQENSAEAGAPANATSGASVEDLQKRIQELEAQVKEKEQKYLYLYAEFDNFKKRAIKERSDLLKFGWENVAQELLQVIDNLERALSHMPASTDKALVDGLNMVLNQFRATLNKQGVQVIESLDKPFDPNVHEAVSAEASDHPAGIVIKEHVRGYTLHGRLLRPSRVVVSEGKK